jgi:hypothetical protein
MSDTNPHDDKNDSHGAFHAASKSEATLYHIKLKLPTEAEMQAIEDAITRALEALNQKSVISALKDENAAHITGRMQLVIAQLQALYLASEYLVELAEKLRKDAHDIAEAIERPDDSDL